jgi:AraC-like DNA-binding protein
MTVTHLKRLSDNEREHAHDEAEILIPGKLSPFHAAYRSGDGRSQSAFVREPFVSVIPPRQVHKIQCGRHCDLIAITLDQLFFERWVRQATGSRAPALLHRYAALDPFLAAIGNALRSQFEIASAPGEPYLESLAGVLAIHLAANYGRQHAATPAFTGLAPHKLTRVQAFVNEHFGESIAVQQLAAIAHMSPFHFARMFKRATGQPPHVYITMRRLEHAKRLLLESNLPLVEVAASAGFQTQAHFTEVFHKHMGVTPRAFRLNSATLMPA